MTDRKIEGGGMRGDLAATGERLWTTGDIPLPESGTYVGQYGGETLSVIGPAHLPTNQQTIRFVTVTVSIRGIQSGTLHVGGDELDDPTKLIWVADAQQQAQGD